MSKALYCERAERVDEALRGEFLTPCIGRLAVPGPSGEIVVEYNGLPMTARLLSGVSRSELTQEENRGREVLLIFARGNHNQPTIVGLMENPIENLVSMEIADAPLSHLKDALVDGKRVTIEAQEEIVLKCGEGSITLRKDGKIVIKGTHLLSRSSGPIRVKGASVNIN